MMKNKIILISVIILVLVVLTGVVVTQSNNDCVSIGKGIFYLPGHYLEGTPISKGYDDYGFNYQSHLFKGYFVNHQLGEKGYPPYMGDSESYLQEYPEVEEILFVWVYRDVELSLKWNEAWLSNKDCDGDGDLDRRPDTEDYIGSGASMNFKMNGVYEDGIKWSYKARIIAAPLGGSKIDGIWYDSEGNELGESIWNQFYLTSEVLNDPLEGQHGSSYMIPPPIDIEVFFP